MTHGRRPRSAVKAKSNGDSTSPQSDARQATIGHDRQLVTSILNGSVTSWQDFVTGYTNLIMKVLRQVLFVEDDDEICSVYVDLLGDLYHSRLTRYEGRATLSTWLVLVTRGYAVDYLRHKRGRPRPPRGYEKLSELEQAVYRWHFVEGVSFDAVLAVLNIRNERTSTGDLTRAIRRIEETIDARTLRRLDRERTARGSGHGSRREMEYFVHMRLESSRRSEENGREAIKLIEAEETRERLNAVRNSLPREEREVVDLRFGEGLTAGEISRRVGWATPRRVYSLIESALTRFRKEMIGSTEKQKDSGT